MGSFSEVLTQMITLFIVILVGFFVAKIKIINLETNKRISSLILNVTSPALIISSVICNKTTASNETVLMFLGCTIALYTFLIILGLIMPKLLGVTNNQKYLYIFMTIFSNIGFMGYPVIESIFGTGAIFLASIFSIGFNPLAFSLGIALAAKSGGQTGNFDFKKCINPGIIASILAVILFMLNLDFPDLIKKPVALVGSVTTPLSMMVIGVALSNLKLKEVFNSIRMYIFLVIKLIIIPMLILIFMKYLNFEPIVIGVTVVIAAMPVGTNAVIMATDYDGDTELATKGVFLSTLLSVFTIPIITLFL